MKKSKEKDESFRNGDWGPKYLCRGPHCEWGVILLGSGQAMPVHGHGQVVEDFFVLEGSPVIVVDGVPQQLHAGDVLRLDPPERHEITNPGSEPARLIFIKAPYLPDDKC